MAMLTVGLKNKIYWAFGVLKLDEESCKKSIKLPKKRCKSYKLHTKRCKSIKLRFKPCKSIKLPKKHCKSIKLHKKHCIMSIQHQPKPTQFGPKKYFKITKLQNVYLFVCGQTTKMH